VAVLDLDPGQPEYGPPGVVSLNKISSPNLSPSFCHPALEQKTTQLRAHAIASVTPALDPGHFIECALDLFSHYQTGCSANCPLIINTPGWIQGTGLDILAELVREMRPTEVIYMSQEGPEETVDGLKSVCRDIPFYTLPSQSGEATPRTSMHLRTMQAMSYFHLSWSSLPTQHPYWDPTPLTELRPWRVRYGGQDRGFVGVLCYDHQPTPDLLAEAINGMILALVKVESKAAYRDLAGRDLTERKAQYMNDGNAQESSTGIVRTAEGIPLLQNPQGRTLDPRYSKILGLVLVRGIDTQRGELQLITPLPSEIVSNAGKEVVLVAGKFDTPNWAYAEDLHQSAFESTTPADVGGSAGVEDDSSDESDSSEDEATQSAKTRGSHTDFPWVEMLHGNQKRSVGSRVWRVRRDLGRN
jgi:polynucleotide 5'-hydroxyl-kinase GRC3/NOL9